MIDDTEDLPMNHDQFKGWLHLLLHGEIGGDEQAALEQHLSGCQECRSELEELRKLRGTLAGVRRLVVTDALLQEARNELRSAIRRERNRVSLWTTLMNALDQALAPWAKVSVAGVTMIAVGFLAGYWTFSGDTPPAGVVIQSVSEGTDVTRGEARVMNVRFDDGDPSDGTIEFTFEAVSPVRVKGSPNDPGVQSVLTRALITEQNPGVRLRTVSAMTSQIQIGRSESDTSDNDVKRALVDAMKFDDNPGVRKQALQALKKFPLDAQIKQGLLYVLSQDRNEGMRVEAINSLAEARNQFKATDEQLLETLQRRVETDNNRYVRQRARAVLEEVRQQ